MSGAGKFLVLTGGVFVVAGLVLIFFEKIPFLGKLPGDIHIKKENVEIYIPIATSLLISAVLSLVLWVISFLGKK